MKIYLFVTMVQALEVLTMLFIVKILMILIWAFTLSSLIDHFQKDSIKFSIGVLIQ